MINNDMKKIFSIETEPAADDILAAQPADARQSLYDETMRFFAQLYGEDTEDSSYNESTDEASYEEESYNEEYWSMIPSRSFSGQTEKLRLFSYIEVVSVT